MRREKKTPETDIEAAITTVPLFSPIALCIDWHSFPILLESSDVLIMSNHPISYFNMDSRYATLVFIPILSDAIMKKVKNM